jgi:NADH dehydrogenase [ubiquinone] 1 alpha subcomplex assembly factor 1
MAPAVKTLTRPNFHLPVRDAGPVDPAEVNALGFLLSDKKAGPFKLEVEWVKVTRGGGGR